MFYMVIYVTLTSLTEHGTLSLLRAKLSFLIRFYTYNIGQIDIFFVLKKFLTKQFHKSKYDLTKSLNKN